MTCFQLQKEPWVLSSDWSRNPNYQRGPTPCVPVALLSTGKERAKRACGKSKEYTLNAYQLFVKEMYPKLVEEKPDIKTPKVYMKMCSALWQRRKKDMMTTGQQNDFAIV